MEGIRFGGSDLKVSRLGLGLAALGRPGYINLGHGEDLNHSYEIKKMESQTHQMIDEAIASGISYFDAAQSYGKAELFLSNWLKKNNPKSIVVGSKWGYYYTADWAVEAQHHEIKEHTLKRLNLQWPSSKERLEPYLKIYQIHSATFESGVLENRKVLERLGELKADGTTIGLSVSGASQAEVIQQALTTQVDNEPLFGSIQATYNILEQSTGEVLREAHNHGIGVIIKEGVANGRLTNRNESAPFYTELDSIAKKYEVDIDAIALAFILHQPFVHVALSGAAQVNHLRSNISALGVKLDDQDLIKLSELKMEPSKYWNIRSGLAWN